MSGAANKSGGARAGAGAKKKIFTLNVKKPILLDIEGRGKEHIKDLVLSHNSLSFTYKGRKMTLTYVDI